MRIIYCAFFALALMNGSFALQTDDPSGPADILIVKFDWKAYTLRKGWDKEPDRTSIDAVRDERRKEETRRRPASEDERHQKYNPEQMPDIKRDPPVGKVKEYQYRAAVKNAGAKTIKAVAWAYVFFDEQAQEEVARHSFVSRKKIKPGETKELEDISMSPPTPVVSAASAGTKSGFAERIVINKVEYMDGSVWQRTAKPADK